MKNMKKTIALILCVLFALTAFSMGLYAFAEGEVTTTGIADETTTGDALSGIIDYFDGIDLGIDGYGIISRFGKIFDFFISICNKIIDFVTNSFSDFQLPAIGG